MKLCIRLAITVFLVTGVGCDAGAKSSRGFRLPDGDVEQGKATFVALGCKGCHTIAGVELPPSEKPSEVEVVLGGETRRVRTYGELVTSIINPSHTLAKGYPEEKIAKDGKSRMTNFNDVMNVSQLIDLVAFLQTAYHIKVDDSMYYPYAY